MEVKNGSGQLGGSLQKSYRYVTASSAWSTRLWMSVCRVDETMGHVCSKQYQNSGVFFHTWPPYQIQNTNLSNTRAAACLLIRYIDHQVFLSQNQRKSCRLITSKWLSTVTVLGSRVSTWTMVTWQLTKTLPTARHSLTKAERDKTLSGKEIPLPSLEKINRPHPLKLRANIRSMNRKGKTLQIVHLQTVASININFNGWWPRLADGQTTFRFYSLTYSACPFRVHTRWRRIPAVCQSWRRSPFEFV